jgi:transcription elongation factor GreB
VSRAFTKESENDEDDYLLEALDSLPLGSKNHITTEGHMQLATKLRALRYVEWPKVVETISWAAGNGDRSENSDYIYGKKRLHAIDRRMGLLLQWLDNTETVDPALYNGLELVFFGATITYETSDGDESTVRIVGVDVSTSEHAQVSWIPPIARALHKAHEGDVVMLRTPARRRGDSHSFGATEERNPNSRPNIRQIHGAISAFGL